LFGLLRDILLIFAIRVYEYLDVFLGTLFRKRGAWEYEVLWSGTVQMVVFCYDEEDVVMFVFLMLAAQVV